MEGEARRIIPLEKRRKQKMSSGVAAEGDDKREKEKLEGTVCICFREKECVEYRERNIFGS